ncbi:MAG: nucleotidyltransferase domain-containing protein [Pseudomonadota bacterium]|nr:nucleotidyltransferase domain-containing protein [Pseudomonadota bacterium]MDP1905437.1 nucleotidyltransferase domain-containing protein [Pseudomonadota bacterium]MDP2354086.1 nucleotidyltransferase domain-containing protein [Pseudomonadota bacterium]
MGMTSHSRQQAASAGLAGALFTSTQQRVLSYLFGQPERSFFGNELIKLTGSGSGAVQRELKRLVDAELVTVTKVGSQKHFQANPQCPIYAELCGIVNKTVGLAEPLRASLHELQAQVDAAFVYGSVAKGADTAGSDIDLMVISDTLGYSEVFGALEPVSVSLGRVVNPTVYSRAELAKRLAEKNVFVTRVMAQAKVWIYGDDDAIAA